VAACVAAASVVAKVTRDRFMCRLAETYPQYAFERHKGYSTPEHGDALRLHGPCPEHRFSYVNVASAVRAAPGLDEVEINARVDLVGQDEDVEILPELSEVSA
jgi:ribonuclease HII